MTNAEKPRYRSGKVTYVADDCGPVREAAARGSVEVKAFVHGHYPGEILPQKTLPELLSVGYWNAEQDQNWGLDWHRNEGLELSYLRNGTVDFMTSDYSGTLASNTMMISGPWQLHRLGNPFIGAGTLQWIILDQNVRRSSQKWSWPHWIVLTEEDRNELTRLLLYNRNPVFFASPGMKQSWDRLYRAVQHNRHTTHASHFAVQINEILLLLLEYLRNPDSRKDQKASPDFSPSIRVVQIFLDELKSIPSQLEYPWTVAEMAKSCRMSESRFTHCCRQVVNQSPMNYLNKWRIEFAMKIMREAPEKTITEIAMKCGFSTSQYFATVFKKITDQTPKEYLTRIRIEQ